MGREEGVTEADASRRQRSDVRSQNCKVSPAATIFKIMYNAGDLDTSTDEGVAEADALRKQISEFRGAYEAV